MVSFTQTRSVLLFIPLIPGAAFLGGLATDFGRTVNLEFYTAIAQIIPVLVVALMIEMASLFGGLKGLGRRAAEELSEQERDTHLPEIRGMATFIRSTMSWLIGTAALGEAASLYAIAFEKTTTFLFLTSVFAAATMLWMMLAAHLQRFKVS